MGSSSWHEQAILRHAYDGREKENDRAEGRGQRAGSLLLLGCVFAAERVYAKHTTKHPPTPATSG